MNRCFLPLGLSLAAVATAQDLEFPPAREFQPLAVEEVESKEDPDSSSEEAPPAPPLEAPEVTAPDGFPLGGILPTPARLREGLGIGVSSSLVYDSNINPGLGGGGQEEGDMIFTIGPTMSYRSQGSLWNLGAQAALNYATYFDNSDLGGLGYSGNLDIGYNGNPLTVRGSIGTSLTNGTNRYYGSYSESLNYNTSLSASYRWSAKTSFDARFSYRWTDPGDAVSATGTSFGGSESTSFDVSAMWRASPLIRVGPGVAWSWDSGDNQVDRESVGPILRLQYQLARKVSMDGTFGLDFVDYAGSGGGDDTAFSTRLGVNYQASQLWGMNLSVYQGTSADGASAGTYRENFAVRLGYNRRIRRANLALGVGYETNDSVSSTGATVGGGAGDYMTFNASLGMPILRQRVMASTFFDWRDESGGGGNSNGDGYRIGIGLSSGF